MASLWLCGSMVAGSDAGAQIFSPPVSLHEAAGELHPAPSLATDGTGHWVVIGDDDTIFAVRSDDNGDSWSPPVDIAPATGGVGGGDIATDGSAWIVVYTGLNPTTGAGSEVFYSRSFDAGASWSLPSLLITTAATDGDFDYSPVLATDSQGTWVATWNRHIPHEIYSARSTDDGATWSGATFVSTGLPPRGAPAISVNDAQTWMIVWGDSAEHVTSAGSDMDVYRALSIDAGQNWSPPDVVNTNATSDVGTDGDGFVSIAAQGQTWVVAWRSTDELGAGLGTDFDIATARSLDDGLSWSPPVAADSAAATDGTDIEFYPVLGNDGADGWMLVWPEAAPSDLFFARSSDGLAWSPRRPVDPMNSFADADRNQQLLSDGRGHWFLASWSYPQAPERKLELRRAFLRLPVEIPTLPSGATAVAAAGFAVAALARLRGRRQARR